MALHRMLRHALAAIVVAACLPPVLTRVQAQDAPVELTVSSWLPPTHELVADFLKPWMEEVRQATDSRVQLRLLPKPVTNPVGHYEAARNGMVDLTFISNSYYPGRLDIMKFPMLPFSGNSAESTSVATWRVYEKYLQAAGIYRGVKVLSIYGHGPGAIFTSGHKVDTIDDFRGLRIRVGGGMAADVARVLGINAIMKPAPESYELMSTGIVDGVFFPPEAMTSFRLDSLTREGVLFPGGLYADIHTVIMNPASFEKLPARDREILLRLSGEYMARMAGRAWGAADVAALEHMKQRKANVHEASPALVEAVRQKIAPLTEQWLQTARAEGIDGPEILRAFRSELDGLESRR